MLHKAKRQLLAAAACVLLFMLLPVSAFAAAPQKSGSLCGVYAVTFALSLAVFVGYCVFVKHKSLWLFLLGAAVALANGGYLALAMAKSLSGALLANQAAYLGSATLPLAMLMIVMDACRARPPKWLRVLLVLVSLAAFLLAAGADAWGLYYKEVSFEVVDGTAVLVKVYGPLHSLYGAYLFLYFALMLACVAKAALHKPVQQSNYLLFLAAIVFSNLLVWLIEQLAEVRFEFLAVSYIVTELLLFLVHGMHKADAQREADGDADAAARQLPDDAMALLDSFAQKAASLTASERSILHLYAAGKDVAEVAELSFISIHTVRKHNMNIYRKLDVSSREELVLYIELLRRCGRLDALLKLPAHSERQ